MQTRRSNATTLTFGATGFNSISPATITDGGGTGGSDSITIRYGNSLGGGIPTQITAAPTASVIVPGTARDVPMSSSLGCKDNDIVLIVNGGTCAMTSVAASGVPNATTITLADNTSVTANAAIIGANVSCLGTWTNATYAVNNGNLERNGVPVVPGIVNLQVQYGISAAGLPSTAANFNQVTAWVDATGAWAIPTVTDRNRIKAVRIAVIARNAKMELEDVSSACSTTTAASPTGTCAWAGTAASPAPILTSATVNLSGDPNWKKYRYRIFETIIPLRNVIWAKDTL